MRLKPRHTLWLAVLAALIAVAVVTSTAPPAVIAALLGLFLTALAASWIEFQPRQLRSVMSPSPLTRMRMSPAAREATERARRRSSYIPPGLTLVDVGLITLHAGEDGKVLRRSRSISLDDNGVRPYITLNVAPEEADRNALVRYEIIDHNGQTQYVHEMKVYLRDGEMNILPDQQLPLSGNERLSGAGDWDLRVFVDGALVGLLNFTTTGSLREREKLLNRLTADDDARLVSEDEESAPVSLEDLMREQRRRSSRD
jgi:hypothetical protein